MNHQLTSHGLWAILLLLFVNGASIDQKNGPPDSLLPASGSRLPAPDAHLPTPDSRLPAPGSRLPAPSGIAVVELFTSEGCSSCPPADQALAAAAKAYTGHVYVLGYHVDYWDRLGWKDAFSDAAWTARQSRYAEHFSLSSIYTPQAVVNGKTEFTGSDRSRLFSTIENELKKTAGPAPVIDARIDGDKNITVSCKTNAPSGRLLNIALVQRDADTQVRKGENEGKKLHHVNIVRALKTAPASSSSAVAFRLPPGLPASAFAIIAFIQDKQTLVITAAAEASIH